MSVRVEDIIRESTHASVMAYKPGPDGGQRISQAFLSLVAVSWDPLPVEEWPRSVTVSVNGDRTEVPLGKNGQCILPTSCALFGDVKIVAGSGGRSGGEGESGQKEESSKPPSSLIYATLHGIPEKFARNDTYVLQYGPTCFARVHCGTLSFHDSAPLDAVPCFDNRSVEWDWKKLQRWTKEDNDRARLEGPYRKCS